MKISVIVPIYNSENTLEKCIESICNQTYKNLEIILVNDGSKDKSIDICNKMKNKDSRIIVIDNDNHGVSYSRNCGIEKSTGDYVTFVDSDDYIDTDCYSKLIPYLNDNIDFLRYNFKSNVSLKNSLYDLKDKEIDVKQNLLNLYKHFLTFDETIHCFSVLLLVKKEIIKKLKFNEKLTIIEDCEFYSRLFNVSNKARFCDNNSYYYYINNNSVTQNVSKLKSNIFGILNSNEMIKENIMINDKNLLNKIDANHLRLISNYLFKLYIFDKNKYKDTKNELKKDQRFLKILPNYKYSTKKSKILLFLIKHNLVLLEKIYLYCIKIKRR